MDSIKYINVNGTTYINGTVYENLYASANGTDESIVSTGEKYIWNNKQDAISDLVTIRSGAAAGATAIQSSTKGVAGGVATLNSDGYVTDTELSTTYIGLTAGNIVGEFIQEANVSYRKSAGSTDVLSGYQVDKGGRLQGIKGNTVAWNQLIQNNVNIPFDVDNSDGTKEYAYLSYGNLECKGFIKGHKYYQNVIVNFTSTDTHNSFYYTGHQGLSIYAGKEIITSTITDISGSFDSLRVASLATGKHITGTITFSLIDLTFIYGAGNEPQTVAEFEEDYLAWFGKPLTYEDYDEGSLRPVMMTGLKTVGFNMWDEEYLSGYVHDGLNGQLYIANNTICSKNPIRVLPSTTYYIYDSLGVTDYVLYYDKDMNYSKPYATISSGRGTFTTPAWCSYICFNRATNSGATYTGEICINLSDESRNGEYEPYWTSTLNVPVTTMTGKLNGEGSSVVVFPDGLKKAGDVYDEIVKRGEQTIGIKRIGSVDLGTLTWIKGNNLFYCYDKNVPSDMKMPPENNIKPNFAIAKYIVHEYANANQLDYVINSTWEVVNPEIDIRDSSKSSLTADEFKSSLSGVYLYYELETPQEYVLDDFELPLDYDVDNLGTEEVLAPTGVTTAPPKLSIKYGINAPDTIGNLPHNFVSATQEQEFTEAQMLRARRNINAASQDDMIRVQEQLEAINPKVDNDVYVDMGLPSGLLWAKRNLDVTQPDGFAASPFQYECSFFSWGNVDGHNHTNDTFDYSFDATTYASTPGAKLTGNISLSYDAARAVLGAPWRMPSTNEFQELFNNCDFIDANGDVIASTTTNKLVTMNSIVGIRLKSKINGNILFFPCCGGTDRTSLVNKGYHGNYYTSSFLSETKCRLVFLYSGGVNAQDNTVRHNGSNIRPVM